MKNNKGTAVIEALLIIPVFLFSMLALCKMGQCVIVNNMVYEALTETAEYMSEYAYINKHIELIPYIRFKSYVDDTELVENYIEDGLDGVSFLGSLPADAEGYITLKASYTVFIDLPFIPRLEKKKNIVIKQRAYTGANSVWDVADNNEIYVYITPNREAYHFSRSCSYLMKDFRAMDKNNAVHMGYEPCDYCGGVAEEIVYVTTDGDKYHSVKNCVSVSARVYRTKLSEVIGLGGCRRCTGK